MGSNSDYEITFKGANVLNGCRECSTVSNRPVGISSQVMHAVPTANGLIGYHMKRVVYLQTNRADWKIIVPVSVFRSKLWNLTFAYITIKLYVPNTPEKPGQLAAKYIFYVVDNATDSVLLTCMPTLAALCSFFCALLLTSATPKSLLYYNYYNLKISYQSALLFH